jgi:hypothetical protein
MQLACTAHSGEPASLATAPSAPRRLKTPIICQTPHWLLSQSQPVSSHPQTRLTQQMLRYF